MSATVASEDRFQSIDAVRGFAVLGILLMNIVGMGLPSFAYIDPLAAGNHGPADLWTWAVNNVLTDGKMRGLFTMLFGASAVLIADRAEGQRPGPIQTHYLRMFWLFVIGMVHAYFLWWGDILVCYALVGLLIFPFRKLPIWVLLLIGIGVLLANLAHGVMGVEHLKALKAAADAPGAGPAALKAWQEASLVVSPPPGMLADEIPLFRGDFSENFKARARMAMLLQLVIEPTDAFPEAFGQMLIGMALFKSGFFTLKWPTRAYLAMIAVGYLIAVPAAAWLTSLIWQSGFDPMVRTEWQAWGGAPRPLIALAHASVLLLLIRGGAIRWLVDLLAAAGRMAFSNYLMTSIITTLLFTGIGLGYYGKMSRFELLHVVAAVWLFILVWSKPWLSRFHYGPFEWLWRSLVRMKPQPFLKRGAA